MQKGRDKGLLLGLKKQKWRKCFFGRQFQSLRICAEAGGGGGEASQVVSRGYSLVGVGRLLLVLASLVAEQGL